MKKNFFTYFIVLIGASNTPEYYINMRTGTHYFPRNINGVAAVERNRQKFGLNKIEETAAENAPVALPHGKHRRTESCDSNQPLPARSVANLQSSLHRKIIHSGQTSNISSLEKNIPMTGAKDIRNYSLERGLSPDLQRQLAFQSYKGMECKYNFFLTAKKCSDR